MRGRDYVFVFAGVVVGFVMGAMVANSRAASPPDRLLEEIARNLSNIAQGRCTNPKICP